MFDSSLGVTGWQWQDHIARTPNVGHVESTHRLKSCSSCSSRVSRLCRELSLKFSFEASLSVSRSEGAMPATPGVFGPFLRVHGSIDSAQKWRGSVLICAASTLTRRPAVLLNDGGQQPRFEGSQIDVVADTAFFRMDLVLPLTAQERTIHYFCDLGALQAPVTRYLQAAMAFHVSVSRRPDLSSAVACYRIYSCHQQCGC